MSSDRDQAGGDRRLRLIVATVAVVVCVGTIGTPLLGLDVFFGGDLVERYAPWNALEPDAPPSNPMVGDVVDVAMPARRLITDRARHGDLALWQSYANGGRPLAAIPNVGTFSPLNLPYLVLPLTYAPGVVKLLELAVALLATFAWLRGLGVRRWAALLGGLAYAFNGFQIVYTSYPMAHIGALLPAALWAVDHHLRRRSPTSLVPLVAVVATMWLEGFPQVTGFALLAAGTWALVRLATERGTDVRGELRTGGWLLAAVAVGTAIAAFQLLPWAADLSRLDLGYRVQAPGDTLALPSLVTLVAPDALGSPIPPWSWFGPYNYIEVQSFVGVTVILLAAVGLAGRRTGRQPRWLRPTLAGFAVVPLLLTWWGGPVLRGLQALPLFGLGEIQRIRPVAFLALAALAALGAQRLGEGRRPDRPELARFGTAIAVLAVPLTWAGLRTADLARELGTTTILTDEVRVVLAIAVVAGLGLALAAAVPRTATVVLAGLVVLVALEAARVAGPFWPRVDQDRFYAVTPTHTFLERELGHDRMASGDHTLYPGSTTWYRIRVVGAHAFPVPAWREALEVVDPDAYARQSPTFPRLAPTLAVATSPVLDRLGARYFVTDASHGVFGEPVVDPAPDATATLPPGSVTVPVPATDRALRGLVLDLPSAPPADVDVVAVLLDDQGNELAEGRRRITPLDPPGATVVPVAEAPRDRVTSVRLTVDAPGLTVGTQGGTPALGAIVAQDDGLTIAHAWAAVAYRREHALGRIRWASRGRVVTDGSEQLDLLAAGTLPDDTVVLGAPLDGGDGGDGRLTVVTDGGDTVTVAVDADGPGYLVVADSMADDWQARVDGEVAPLAVADHVGVAVAVPGGEHVVTFSYTPAGWHLGLAVTAGALLLVAVAVVWDRRRRRART